MCRKLGKRKLKELYGDDYNRDLRRDDDGKLRRNKHGHVIGDTYNSRILNAWQGADNRIWPDQSTNNYKVTRAKKKYVERLDNLYIFGSIRPTNYEHSGCVKRARRLLNQQITRLGRLD